MASKKGLTMSTPIRVRKLDEQSTGQWPDAASGKEMLDKEEEDEEDEEDEDIEEKVFLALAKGEPSPLDKE